jgi:hypothetical protein
VKWLGGRLIADALLAAQCGLSLPASQSSPSIIEAVDVQRTKTGPSKAHTTGRKQPVATPSDFMRRQARITQWGRS